MSEMRLLDDDIDIEKIYKKACDEALESLAKEKIKSRLATMPKIYMVSSYPLDKESLLELVKMQPILPKYEDCTIIYLGTYYKPLKRRTGYDKQRKYRKIKKRY